MTDMTPTPEKKSEFFHYLKEVLIKDHNINPEQANHMIQNTYLQDLWDEIIMDKDISYCIFIMHYSLDRYAKELIDEFNIERRLHMDIEHSVEVEHTQEKKYYQVRNAYLANGLSFLGYRYRKYGFGKDTVYSFENTHGIQDAVEEILELKKRVGLY